MVPTILKDTLPALSLKLKAIRKDLLQQEQEHKDCLELLHPNYRESGKNFIHYLTLRTLNLRKLQEQLSNVGLSSIGSSERYNLANLENIIAFLDGYHSEESIIATIPGQHALNYFTSKNILAENTERLLGSRSKELATRIMVTLPSAASTDEELIKKLMEAGMNIARINCSHDQPDDWKKMIKSIQKIAKKTNKKCSICMDLGGPKLRTGPIAIKRKTKKGKEKTIDFILLHEGDLLEIHRKSLLGEAPYLAKDKSIPAKISISLPSVFEDIKTGDRVSFDDGKIDGKIIKLKKDKALVKIIRAAEKGSKLRAEKGINFPDSNLNLPCLTPADLEYLPFITKHADMVGFSFVKNAQDVAWLQEQLKTLKRESIGIILKIETKEAFENLPAIILQAMKSANIGVMTARGDLAIEIGWERIAEVQEEILWFCEAAHIPNIWATQVLETLTKTGLVTRAEITDAAMSERAECVMLNKGPYIEKTLKTLSNILQRMETHQQKRKGTFRPLKVAQKFLKQVKQEPDSLIV